MAAVTSANSPSLRQALEYCLDVLKIKQHLEFMIRTTANVPMAMVRTHGNWITAMKLIADWNGALGNSGDNYIFSQTQLYDFLALAAKVIEEKKKKASDNNSQLKKISELCRNYSKLQRYSKLITSEGSHTELKNELQREIGREIRSDELGHVIRSIRRVQLYIENILDDKFTLDTSHGINHIKHNLEYGYSLMNLIELPKRRPRTEYQK